MRYVVIGAGAIGGVLGGRLHQYGRDVLLVARGANFERLRERGLSLASPAGTEELEVPVTSSLAEVKWRADDVVILAVKSQATEEVLAELQRTAPSSVAVVCAQNGLENERMALRLFADVYGMCVMCPSAYLQPGEVQLYCEPVSGVMDLGRWPTGRDDRAILIAADLEDATFRAEARDDIATLKWGKLLSNLGNAVEALCRPTEGLHELLRRTREEADVVLAAHGIDAAAAHEALLTRMSLVEYRSLRGANRGGGSSWQSLARGTGDIESNYLNGEIVLLGRLHGVPTPVNELLQRRAVAAAVAREHPGQHDAEEFLAELNAVTS